jgi:CspA family cold shock protein
MMIGTLDRYDDQRGFGFIKPDEGGADVFVHLRDAQRSGLTSLAVGDRLEFLVERSPRDGKIRAAEIRLAG